MHVHVSVRSKHSTWTIPYHDFNHPRLSGSVDLEKEFRGGLPAAVSPRVTEGVKQDDLHHVGVSLEIRAKIVTIRMRNLCNAAKCDFFV